MKIDLKSLFNIAMVVGPMVKEVQNKWKGSKTGTEKKEIVVDTARELLPVVEGLAGKDLLDDDLFNQALSDLIDLEKAVLKAREKVEALIAARRAVNNDHEDDLA